MHIMIYTMRKCYTCLIYEEVQIHISLYTHRPVSVYRLRDWSLITWRGGGRVTTWENREYENRGYENRGYEKVKLFYAPLLKGGNLLGLPPSIS